MRKLYSETPWAHCKNKDCEFTRQGMLFCEFRDYEKSERNDTDHLIFGLTQRCNDLFPLFFVNRFSLFLFIFPLSLNRISNPALQ